MKSRTLALSLLAWLLLLTGLMGAIPAAPPIQDETITVGVYENMPLSIISEDGTAQGFVIDILEYIASQEGWNLEYTACDWSACLEMLEIGQIDLFGPIVYSQERNLRFDFSAETLITNWGQIYTQPSADLDTFMDLDGKSVVMLTNDIHAIAFQDMANRFDIQCRVIEVDNYAEVFRLIEAGEADSGVVNRLFAERNKGAYQVVSSPIIFNPVRARFATTKGQNTDLLQAIDRHMEELKGDNNSYYYKSLNKWLNKPTVWELPEWAQWIIGIIVGLSLLLMAGIFVLNKRIAFRTQELQDEVGEHKRTAAALKESEQKYRSLVEQSADAIYLLYEDCFEIINPSFTELFGITPEEANSADFNFMKLVAPKSRSLIEERTQQMAEGQPLSPRYKFTALNVDGAEIEVEVSVSYLSYRGGIATQGVLRDITEQVRAEDERELLLAKVREQSQQVREIMNTVPDGVLLLNAEGIILLANPAAQEILETQTRARVGEPLKRLGDRPIEELLEPPPGGLWHEVESGKRVFEISGRPVEIEGDPRRWVLVLREVTQEREAQAGIQRQERMAAVGQLAAGIAHDFNNSLAVVLLYSEIMLNNSELDAKLRKPLRTILEEGKRAANLVQQILDFSRRSIIERRPVDILPLLDKQVRLLERTLPENIRVWLKYSPGEYMVNADPTRIQQAIMNLALNTRDAMPNGGELTFNVSVLEDVKNKRCLHCGELLSYLSDDWLQIIIQDNGSGIPEEAIPHIFDPFFTTKGPGEGAGLGLSQVFGIIKQHEGHIEVASEAGQGTTIYLYLPLMQIVQPAEQEPDPISLIYGQGQTILLVEDEKSTQEVLEESLTRLNYHVIPFNNGIQALEYLDQRVDQVSLVISDVVMPELGGVDLFHKLRQRGDNVPVILLTGHSLDRELENLRHQGLSDWLLKPPTLAQLSLTVSQTLKIKEG